MKLHNKYILPIGIVLSIYLYTSGIDLTIHKWIMANFSVFWMQETFGYLSRMGQDWFQILICAGFAFYHWKYSLNKQMLRVWLLTPVAFFMSGVIGYIFKIIIGRPRPKLAMGKEDMYDIEWFETASRLHSYPSGHTLTTFAFCAVVSAHFPKYRVQFFIVATIISLSRMGIGAHYTADVVAGAVIGYSLGIYFMNKLKISP